MPDVPDRTLAAMRFVGPAEKLPAVWPRFLDRIRQVDLPYDESELLGMYSDGWNGLDSQNHRFDAGIVLADDNTPEGLSELTVPAGNVAMALFRDLLSEFDRT